MSIDINEIVQKKITEMEESGEIKKHLEDKLQSLILDSVSSALSDYDMKRQLQKKIENCISPCLDTLNFTAYNSFICEKIKQITEQELQEDIAKKVSGTFENIFMLKRENIKLSEIFKAYREWAMNGLEEEEKWELDNEFYANIEEDDDWWLNCSISERNPEKSALYSNRKDIYRCDFGFTIFKSKRSKDTGTISTVYFEGKSVKDVLKVTSYNKFQTLLLNLYYNETPIIIDIEDESDIDTSLGLDF